MTLLRDRTVDHFEIQCGPHGQGVSIMIEVDPQKVPLEFIKEGCNCRKGWVVTRAPANPLLAFSNLEQAWSAGQSVVVCRCDGRVINEYRY